MRQTLLTCDWCGNKIEVGEFTNGLPEEWFVLGFHKGSFVDKDDWRITHHFCSEVCMNKAVKIKSLNLTPWVSQ